MTKLGLICVFDFQYALHEHQADRFKLQIKAFNIRTISLAALLLLLRAWRVFYQCSTTPPHSPNPGLTHPRSLDNTLIWPEFALEKKEGLSFKDETM